MAVININELNPGAWFFFEEDEKVKEKDRARVKIRAAANSVIDELVEKHVKTDVEYKRKAKHGELQRFEVVKFPPENKKAYKHDLWDHVIVGWENFFDESTGEKVAIECTRENKILLMANWPEFNDFVNRCTEKLTGDVEKEVEEAEKN